VGGFIGIVLNVSYSGGNGLTLGVFDIHQIG